VSWVVGDNRRHRAQELLGPLSQGHLGVSWIEPTPPRLRDVHLDQGPLRVSLAGERLGALTAERVAIPGEVLLATLLDEPH
jgi:hypothetical protein